MRKKVYVGMSGGVDSSVTAALLKEQGYEVVGVYMKNWTKDITGFKCPWQDDFEDAKRVAVQLGIELKVFDFQKEYKQKVVDYMIAEYEAGRTPNPDIMCNQEVKFKLFLDAALEDGADLIATGHYAATENGQLLKANNKDKDQTYFMYRVTGSALKKTLLPLGKYSTKQQVRDLAKRLGLSTAAKKDSQGICFVGKVGIKEFLQQYVTTKRGQVLDKAGRIVGEHDGAIFYTIGQRHGLNIGGGLPFYVTGKNIDKNEVYVTTDLDDGQLWMKKLTLSDAHWINGLPKSGGRYNVQTRYRAPFVSARVTSEAGNWSLELDEEVRAITPGQSAVIYDGERVVGGGICL